MAITNVPAFVHAPAVGVTVGRRELRVDVAFGGAFYAIVDSEATGVPLDSTRLPDLRRLGAEITASLNAAQRPVHPFDPSIGGVAGVIFTGPATIPRPISATSPSEAQGRSIDRRAAPAHLR